MARNDDNTPLLPPQIKAAMDYLWYTRLKTAQTDASIPARDLTPLEKSVETAALRALQQYLLGEMDFTRASPPDPPNQKDDDNNAGQAVKTEK